MEEAVELTYKQLHDLIGKAIEEDEKVGDKEVLIVIGNPRTSAKVTTVRGFTTLHDIEGELLAIQGTWNNGKLVKD